MNTPEEQTIMDQEERTREVMGWLVRFQVKGESLAAIAASANASGRWHGITPQVVRRAIREASELIGLPLRPESEEQER